MSQPVPVHLVPLQCWGLAHLGAPDLWALSLLVRASPDLDPDRLRTALNAVVSRHAGLRLRAYRDPAGDWRAAIEPERAPAFRVAGTRDGEEETIARLLAEERKGLSLDRGPILRAVCLGAPGSWHVLFVVHHFVFDAQSWLILLEDLETAYADVRADEAADDRGETEEYAAWTARLHARGRSAAGRAAAEYWCGEGAPQAPALPVEDPGAPALERLASTATVALPPDLTGALVERARTVPGASLRLVLAAAVHRAVEAWSGERRMGLWFLAHGRNSPVATERTQRLIGFVAYSYPVVLEPAPDGGDVWRLAADIGRQEAAVPDGGLDYEISRYIGDEALSERMGAVRLPGILLNFIGTFTSHLPGPVLTGIDPRVSFQARDPEAARMVDFEVEVLVWDGALTATWKYVRGRHSEATVAALTDRFRAALVEAAGG